MNLHWIHMRGEGWVAESSLGDVSGNFVWRIQAIDNELFRITKSCPELNPPNNVFHSLESAKAYCQVHENKLADSNADEEVNEFRHAMVDELLDLKSLIDHEFIQLRQRIENHGKEVVNEQAPF